MKLLLALVLILFLSACEKEHDTRCIEEVSSFYWQKDRSLEVTNTLIEGDTVRFVSVQGGEQLLFTYQYDSEVCTDRQDDGFTRYLRFVVPANAKSFHYTDAGLAEALTNYTVSGWWVNAGAHPVTKGTITGKLISQSQWKVTLDLYLTDYEPARHILLERTFNLK